MLPAIVGSAAWEPSERLGIFFSSVCVTNSGMGAMGLLASRLNDSLVGDDVVWDARLPVDKPDIVRLSPA